MTRKYENNKKKILRQSGGLQAIDKRMKRILPVLLAVIILAGTSACGTQKAADLSPSAPALNDLKIEESPYRREDGGVSIDVFAMDTFMTLTAYGVRAEEAVRAAAAEIHHLDDQLSAGDPDSEISQINAAGEGEVTDVVLNLIERSQRLRRETGGLFEIAIYPIMKLWGFPSQNYRVPDNKEIEAALKLANASAITIAPTKDGAPGTKSVTFGIKGMEIDLGGIAKGYTSSRVMEIFREHGIEHGLVSLGGNVQALGDKEDGSAWRVAIQDPESESDYLGVLEIRDKCVITSGAYERFFEKNGVRYHHIIDPRTGYPADSGIVSSTIVSDDGTLADGLSTALFIMGKDGAETFWRAHQNQFDYILEDQDGTLYVTEGAEKILSTKNKTVIVRK